MLGVQLDRLDNQVEGINAVDFARYAIGEAWRETEAFGEVPTDDTRAGYRGPA